MGMISVRWWMAVKLSLNDRMAPVPLGTDA